MTPDMPRADYGSQIVVDHTNDPSFAVAPPGQEVMFFDAYASTNGGVSNANSVGAGRSSHDGKAWSGKKPINPRLPPGVTGPQNPCAVRVPSGDWRVYFPTSAGDVGTIWEVTLNPNLDPITKARAVFDAPNWFAQNPEVFKAKGKWTLLYDTKGDNPNGGYRIHVAV